MAYHELQEGTIPLLLPLHVDNSHLTSQPDRLYNPISIADGKTASRDLLLFTTTQHSALMWGEYAYSATITLHFRSLAKGGVDFPFRSPVTPPPPPATAWQQARQPRIESSASIAGGTKTRVSPGSDKETYPPAPLVPTIKGKTVGLCWHPDSDFQPAKHFPCSTGCHCPQTDRAACCRSNFYRQAV